MGVSKLWELLLTIAQPLSIDQLSGKVLAIDASIWIVKIDSLYNSNAEKLKSILSKIMLLKRNNILPVFVFDGVAPALKRRTLEERYQKRLVAGELEAKKKSEIEIMKMIEGGENSSTRQSQKSRKIKKNEEDLSQLNKTLRNLSEFQQRTESQVGNELIEKISLQSEILNTKYRIMLELTPNLEDYKFFLGFEQYQALDLERKIDFLEELQEFKWKHIKKQRNETCKASLNEEQKLKRDLEIIEKRSVIREMQDNLFRKMMQKNVKIENGFEIIETIYNGKKVIQKRKVKQQNSNSFGFGLRKGKMKNDVNCLNFKEGKLSSDEEQDDFLAEFCSTTISKKPTQPTHSSLVENSQSTHRRRNDPSTVQHKHESEDSAQNYIPFQNYQKLEAQEQQPERYVNKRELNERFKHEEERDFENRDSLPTYIPNESLLYINYSNDNLELQNLLKILGIPFLIAPSEAEAQCAALEQMGVVDGIVTQDSDVFLFGGKNVFRGVFQNNIRYYNYKNMQEKLKLTREKLIIFALLLGSDYTGGVKGVGLVNAMEIIKVFTSFEKLEQFKKWAKLPDVLLPEEEKTAELLRNASKDEIEFYELHRKFKNYWYVDDQFGNKRVRDAYLLPEVVKEEQIQCMKREGKFKSKPCNKEVLSKLLKEKLDLQEKEFEHYMKLLAFQFTDKRENSLLNYFTRGDQTSQFARIRSKRLQRSLELE